MRERERGIVRGEGREDRIFFFESESKRGRGRERGTSLCGEKSIWWEKSSSDFYKSVRHWTRALMSFRYSFGVFYMFKDCEGSSRKSKLWDWLDFVPSSCVVLAWKLKLLSTPSPYVQNVALHCYKKVGSDGAQNAGCRDRKTEISKSSSAN